ncbi:hypothetical protein JZ751_004357 [Albula glossodonta]|uniref:Uncharacterized protein n=1 Tax=Albula glossodonta TaxID=121402 RepID=A0A8T2MYP4_9TELE|nr:hypothetical protein JZ751_004357 [Albula glossodonta]
MATCSIQREARLVSCDGERTPPPHLPPDVVQPDTTGYFRPGERGMWEGQVLDLGDWGRQRVFLRCASALGVWLEGRER